MKASTMTTQATQASKFISDQGYSVSKAILSDKEYQEIKKDLTVKPFTMPDFGEAKPFKLFQEGPTKIYMPKFYGLKRFGDPDVNRQANGLDISLEFSGNLRQEQVKPVNAFMEAVGTNHCTGGILNLTCASGKCLGKNTPIMMFNGKTRKVQDIIPGDILMGDDMRPRYVITICLGRSTMYSVHQDNGITYRVNDVHILTLYDTYKKKLVDLEVGVYMSTANRGTRYLGARMTTNHELITYPIKVEKEDGMDDYFGFTITGNRRFLLADGTITHNTVMAIHLICKLGKKALVVVHKDFLLQQWKERFLQFAPSARLGLIKAKTIDVEDKDIVLASLQSLCMKDYPEDIFKDFGLVVIDEVHHTSAEVFSKALRKIAFKYTLGLSATINRKDGLSKVFKWYLGDVLYSNVNCKENGKTKKDRVDVLCCYHYTPDPEYSREEYMMRDKLNISRMINNVCEYTPRVVYVVDVLMSVLRKEPDRKVIILSDRKQHLLNIKEMLMDKGLSCGGYFGGMKQDDLKQSEKAQIILGTFCMVSEGFDCKGLDTLILASPKSDVVQSVGRILREEADKRRHVPLVIDIIDEFSIFQRQAMKRLKYYKTQKYNLIGEKVQQSNNKLIKLEGPCFVDLKD